MPDNVTRLPAANVSRREVRANSTPTVRKPANEVATVNLPAFSEESLARMFVTQHADEVRYVAAWGKWMVWDGARWKADDKRQSIAMIRALCADISAAPGAEKHGKAIASAKTVRSVEYLANSDPRIAATVDQWDTDPMLLNTPRGVVDLKTGGLRPADSALHMTRVAAVAPSGDCPVFLSFLHRIMNGDVELIAYLQRVFGYMLTGDTSAHALFFGYGTGGNGKSVLIDTIAGILGDYSKSAPIETFATSIVERHPTEIAGLQGARLVTAVETEEGRRWAESRIKSLTGGDKISARFMRQDFFEFQPQFKLLIAGNHKPGLRSVDEAMRRRFHLIPFAVSIPEGERDPGLKDKLKAEWPGILAWMIQGCLEWQQMGLAPPAAVRKATSAYLEAEDVLGAWVEEFCELNSAAWAASGALFNSWKGYAESAGEKPGTSKRLAQMLEDRGLQPKRTNSARGFEGLRLKCPPSACDT